MQAIIESWKEEGQLCHALTEGNQFAFEFVVHEYSGDLLRWAVKWTKDEHQAADLVQDVFLDLWERRAKLRIATSVQAYLYSALKHRFLRLVSRSNLHEQAMSHLLHRMDQMQHSILDVMAASDLQQTLSSAVGRLPENMRKIFILRNEEYTLREIAEVLGLAEQTVKSYHSELNRRLKDAVLTQHPDISHSLLVLIIAKLM